MSRCKKWLPWILVAFVAAAIALLPNILNTHAGRQFLLNHMNERIAGDISVDDWTLSWSGPQRIHTLTLFSEQKNPLLRLSNIIWQDSLWGFFFRKVPPFAECSGQCTVPLFTGGGHALSRALGRPCIRCAYPTPDPIASELVAQELCCQLFITDQTVHLSAAAMTLQGECQLSAHCALPPNGSWEELLHAVPLSIYLEQAPTSLIDWWSGRVFRKPLPSLIPTFGPTVSVALLRSPGESPDTVTETLSVSSPASALNAQWTTPLEDDSESERTLQSVSWLGRLPAVFIDLFSEELAFPLHRPAQRLFGPLPEGKISFANRKGDQKCEGSLKGEYATCSWGFSCKPTASQWSLQKPLWLELHPPQAIRLNAIPALSNVEIRTDRSPALRITVPAGQEATYEFQNGQGRLHLPEIRVEIVPFEVAWSTELKWLLTLVQSRFKHGPSIQIQPFTLSFTEGRLATQEQISCLIDQTNVLGISGACTPASRHYSLTVALPATLLQTLGGTPSSSHEMNDRRHEYRMEGSFDDLNKLFDKQMQGALFRNLQIEK